MSSAEALEQQIAHEPESLVPPWHTAALITLIIAVAVTGTWLSSHGGAFTREEHPTSRILAVYLPLLIVNFALLLYVCRIGRPRSALRDLLGRPWRTPTRALTDVGLALAGCVLIEVMEGVLARVVDGRRSAAVLQILPNSPSERLVWILVAVSVGFCEEVVYRGYLKTQLAALTRAVPIAVVIQGLLFGVAHAEQGLASASRTALYGIALGALAAWRGSLIPGILCHVGLDLVSGLGPSV